MRYLDLFEAYKTISDIEWIKANCSEAIANYNKSKNRLYRGTDDIKNDIVLMTPNKKQRQAANAIMNLHTRMINSGMLGDLPKREIIMSSSLKRASDYGNTSICLPMNGAMIGSTGVFDIYDAFPEISTGYLSGYYRKIDRMIAVAAGIYEKKTGNYVEDIHIDRPSDLNKQLRAFSGYTFTEDDLEEISDYSDLKMNIIRPVFTKLDYKPILEPFYSNNLSAHSMSSLQIQPNIEYWTDSPTVLIPLNMLDEVLTAKLFG